MTVGRDVLPRVLSCISIVLLTIIFLSPTNVRAVESSIIATIDHTKIDANLVDFPIMLKLDESNAQDFFDWIVSDPAKGLKFRIEDSQGSQCYVEKELWDYSSRTVILHVKVSLVSATEDTAIKLYYDETMLDNDGYIGFTGSAAAQMVWDSDFIGVWHMAQDPAGDVIDAIKDSTASANHGTPTGAMTSGNLVDGTIGKAIEFDGSDDGIILKSSFYNTSMSLEGVIKLHDLDANDTDTVIVGRGNTSGHVLTFHKRSDHTNSNFDNTFGFSWDKGSSSFTSYKYVDVKSIWSNDEWHSVCGVTDRTIARTKIYLDGIEPTYKFSYERNGFPTDFNSYCKIFSGANGVADEIRVSKVLRSAAWVKATYLSNFNDLIQYELIVDNDGDGITNNDEQNIYGTDPNIADTDGDGINDGDELAFWGANWNVDYDGDGIISLLDADSDNDGMLDGWEINNGLDPTVDDTNTDTDGDGFSNFIEYIAGASPSDPNNKPRKGIYYEYDSNRRIKKLIRVQ